MKKQVLITQHIPEAGVSLLTGQFEVVYLNDRTPRPASVLAASCPDASAILSLLSDRIDGALMDRFPRLELISNYAAGVNNIDIKAAAARGILVCNTPDVLTEATADLALALLLAAARKIIPADRFCREGNFNGWASDLFCGFGFTGKQMGIIGMGKIGLAFARRAESLGMSVVYSNRTPNPLAPPNYRLTDLESLIKESDVVSLHTPLTPETRGMMNAARFASMKAGSIFLNTGRGELHDEEALVTALASGKLFAAGLDVFEKEPGIHPGLLASGKVVLTPHIGSATVETRNAMAQLAAQAVSDCLNGKIPQNRVIV